MSSSNLARLDKRILAKIRAARGKRIAEQRGLIQKLIVRIEGLCQFDLVKDYLREARYANALMAAGRAATLLQDQRSRRVLLAVRVAPGITRRILLAQDARLGRARMNRARMNKEVSGNG
jgi:hypothetical protein